MIDLQLFKTNYAKLIRDSVDEYLRSIPLLDTVPEYFNQRVHVKLESYDLYVNRVAVKIQIVNDTPYLLKFSSYNVRVGEFAEYLTVDYAQTDHVSPGPGVSVDFATAHFTPKTVTHDLRKYVVVDVNLEVLLDHIPIYLTGENWEPQSDTSLAAKQ